jgi:hypothetical protein
MRSTMLLFVLFIGIIGQTVAQQREQAVQQHGWYMYFGNHRLNDKWGLHTEYQFRRHGLMANWQQSLLRAGLDYHLDPNIQLTAGYGWIVTFPYGAQPLLTTLHENRLWQQALLRQSSGRVRMNHRLRFEQRWVQQYGALADGNLQYLGRNYTNRFRYRFWIEVPLNKAHFETGTWFIAAYNELFVNYGQNLRLNRFDQNRLYGAVGYQFNRHGQVQLGYLQQLIVKPNGWQEELNNTLQVAITYNLDFRK